MTAEAWARWREAREATITRPHGVASLDRTAWLDASWREIDRVPGWWRAADGLVVGELGNREVRLAVTEETDVGDLRVRHFARDGGTAVRVFDPASPNRTTLAGIDSYDFDGDWVVSGTLRAPFGEEYVDVIAVDGLVTRALLAGTVVLPTPAGTVELTLTRAAGGGLSAAISDATSGTETYRFRFLSIAEEGDWVTVDFNRAVLPPCAFSSEYVCPMPLPGNRWTVPVRAGERHALRTPS